MEISNKILEAINNGIREALEVEDNEDTMPIFKKTAVSNNVDVIAQARYLNILSMIQYELKLSRFDSI